MNKKTFLILVIFSLFIANISAATDNWIIATEKFSYSRGQKQNSITEATAESLPVELMEKLGNALDRVILPEESLDRTRYTLRTERLSLFLQLSSAYKKRDAIFLNNYSDKELQKKINEEEKNILTIQEKIDTNLKTLKEAEEKAERNTKKLETTGYNFDKDSEDELKKFSNLFRNLISKEGDLVTSENIAFYQNDNTRLFTPSEKAKEAGYESYTFESEMVSAKINTLLTGVITNYGQYMSLTVTAYAYPGGKVIGSVTELGSMQEKDLLITSLARQLVPILTNAMPVVVNFNVAPEHKNFHLYIDDIIQNVIPENMIIDSGVHNIQITCEGYESAGTNYYFTGNERYKIDINLKPKEEGFIRIGMVKPVAGDIYGNGIAGEKIDEMKTRIRINGQTIIGEFITEDGATDFYFIPENLVKNDMALIIKPKPRDRSDYIDKRRKWMYGSYSLLITSLVPSFYTYGNYYNAAMLANEGYQNYDDLETSIVRSQTALKWQKASRITSYISIGFGVLFVVEMFRYFQAADSVLPQKAKKATNAQQYVFDYVAPPPVIEITENVELDENNLSEESADVEMEITDDENESEVEIENTETEIE